MQSILQGLDTIYPIGAIYLSTSATDPTNIFGGEWRQIKDKFLLSAGDTYSAGDTGGSAAHTMTTTEMPSHAHGLNSHTHGVGSYSAVSVSGHTHGNYSGCSNGFMQYVYDGNVGYDTRNSEDGGNWYKCKPMASAGGHGHSISGASGAASGDTASNGSGAAFSIMPPYLTVYMWERIS